MSNAPNNSPTYNTGRPHKQSHHKTARNKARAARRSKQQQANRLKVLQQNVAGLKKRETELLHRLAIMNIDVAVLQECNFSIKKDSRTGKVEHTIPEYAGWNIEASPRQVGRSAGSDSAGRGGVAILIRDTINYEVITNKPIPVDDVTTEYVGVRVFPNNNKNEPIDIHNLYIPPINESARDEDRVQRWNTSKLPTTNNTFIFSDTNCHGSWDSRLNDNAMSNDWDDWMSANNFSALNTNDSFTRTSSRGHKSSPDITVVPSQWVGKTRWTTLTKRAGGSDHIPILVSLRLANHVTKSGGKRSGKKRQQRTKWSFKKSDWEKFRSVLDESIEDWPNQSVSWTTHKLNNAFSYAVYKAASVAIPRGLRVDAKPFWSDELEAKSKECDAARVKAHVSPEDAESFMQKRKEFDKLSIEEKSRSWHSFVEGIDSKTNPSKLWNVIRGLDGKRSKSKPGVELRENKDSTNIARTDNEKAKLFIDTYIKASRYEEEEIGRTKKIAEKDVIHKMRSATKGCESCCGEKTGMCGEITPDEMELATYKIKSGKAAGPDKITNEMLKNLSTKGKAVLLRLLNQSWSEGFCPGSWKMGEIIPLPKPGKDHQLTGSYRPINLLSVIGKLLERIVKARLEYFLESNNKLDPSQAGFRKGRSTVEQVGRLTQSIYDGFEDGMRTLAVYVDFSKAYDKVWRNKLFAKMGEMEIPGCYAKWVQALLSERNSYVNWYGAKSNKRRFDNGVPQGSVISPLLWLIYINDLASSMPAEVQFGISKSLFADDLALLCKGKTVEECEQKMQVALNCLEKWSVENKMEISITDDKQSKTVSCYYTKNFKEESNNKVVPHLTLSGIQVFHNTAPRFLGVVVDQTLTFKVHTEEKAKKMGKRNNILRALAGRDWGQKSTELRKVHVTFTQPAGEYAIGAWGPFVAKSHMDKLEAKQNQAARIITGCCSDTKSEHLLAEAGLMPIEFRAEQEAVLLHERNKRLPAEVPARQTADNTVLKHHLKKTGADGKIIKPPREKAKSILAEMQLVDIERDEAMTHACVAPWEWRFSNTIKFHGKLEGCSGKNDSPENIHRAFDAALCSIPTGDVISYTDGSVGANNCNGGAGGFIEWPSETETQEIKRPCGSKCSSYRAEMIAIKSILEAIKEHDDSMPSDFNIWIFTDSQSSIERLQGGPGVQVENIAGDIWKLLIHLSRRHSTTLQWIPGHTDIAGNETADKLAKEASDMSQQEVALDFSTVKAAVRLHVRNKWRAAVSARQGIYSKAGVFKQPALPHSITRKQEITIHQLRTGVTPLVRNCWANYARRPDDEKLCPNGCNEKEDVYHVIWKCPYYSALRMKHFGTITPEDDILFGDPYNILKFLKDSGHSTAPTVDENQQ